MGSCESSHPNGISIGSTGFAGFTRVWVTNTDRRTDHVQTCVVIASHSASNCVLMTQATSSAVNGAILTILAISTAQTDQSHFVLKLSPAQREDASLHAGDRPNLSAIEWLSKHGYWSEYVLALAHRRLGPKNLDRTEAVSYTHLTLPTILRV